MANTLIYGFETLAHLANQRVTTVGVDVVWDAIAACTAEYNRETNAALSMLCERTTKWKKRIKLPGGGTLQPLDENGNPRATRSEGYYDAAWPLFGAGDAWGANRVLRAKMTVQEVNNRMVESIRKDRDWLRRHIFGALFYSSNWTFVDELNGSLTIIPFANSDTVTYLKGSAGHATDNHFLAQSASIDDDNNPFDDIYDELMEHASNAPPVIVFVPTNLKSSIENLTAFTPVSDPNIVYGVATDRAGNAPDRGPGDEVLGTVNKCWIIEWRGLPDSYMVAVAGGSPMKALYMREHEESQLQGYFSEEYDVDGNTKGTRMIRYAGFGVQNRIGAVVYYIGGASYTEPTGYDSMPLAV